MLQRWKKNSKKGFTLVELIVVLVILAILAALLIPALTGYIDKAKEKQIIAETRQVVMAAQTLVDEVYGTKNVTDTDRVKFGDADTDDIALSAIANLAEVPKGDGTANGIITIVEGSAYKVKDDKSDAEEVSGTSIKGVVTYVKYMKDGKTCVYTKESAESAGTYTMLK